MPRPVTPLEDALVRAALDLVLPTSVPSYVRRVLEVRRVGDGFHAAVEVFDGGLVGVEVAAPIGKGGYTWLLPPGDAPFLWDTAALSWRRAGPDDVDPNALFDASVMRAAHRLHA